MFNFINPIEYITFLYPFFQYLTLICHNVVKTGIHIIVANLFPIFFPNLVNHYQT
jgi:hypothetical protein